MAKHKHEEQELPFVALMDTMTNVVGVLIIVMVMVGISLASAVNKILSDLPPVTKEEYEKMVQQLRQLPQLPKKPEDIQKEQQIAQTELKKINDELSKVDTTSLETQMKYMDLESFRKKLEEARKEREKQKVEVDKLLAEEERLKALLDQTPVYEPPPPTYVRLPNPRPYPEKPNETRVFVARQGVLYFNEQSFVKPILDGLDKVKSQLEYKDVKIDPFLPMLEKVFGNAGAARQAWPEIAPLVNTFQMELVARAYKALADAKLQPTKQILTALGDVAVAASSNPQAVAEAVAAATEGNLSKWIALDPSKDPSKPTIKALASGNKINFSWGAKTAEVKATPRDVLNYFVKELADMDNIKNRSRSKVIYDAYKLQAILERAAANPSISASFAIKPEVRPGSTQVQLVLSPKAGGGETLEQMRNEASNYQRMLRQVKGDRNGVVVFRVMSDAFDTYLESRKIADAVGVPATWDFLARLDITMPVAGYEVQRFALAPPPVPPQTGTGVRIAPPKAKLD